MKDNGDNIDGNGDSDAMTTGITALWLDAVDDVSDVFFCDNVGDIVGDIDRC